MGFEDSVGPEVGMEVEGLGDIVERLYVNSCVNNQPEEECTMVGTSI